MTFLIILTLVILTLYVIHLKRQLDLSDKINHSDWMRLSQRLTIVADRSSQGHIDDHVRLSRIEGAIALHTEHLEAIADILNGAVVMPQPSAPTPAPVVPQAIDPFDQPAPELSRPPLAAYKNPLRILE